MLNSIHIQNFFGFQDCTINLDKGANVLVGINGSGKSNFFKAITLLSEGVAGKEDLSNLILKTWGGLSFVKNYNAEKGNNSIVEFELIPSATKNSDFKFQSPLHYKITLKPIGTGNNYTIDEKLSINSNKGKLIYIDFHNGTGQILEKSPELKKYELKYTGLNEQELALKTIYDPVRFHAQSTLKDWIKQIKVYTFFNVSSRSEIRQSVTPTLEDTLSFDGSNLPVVLFNLKHNNRKAFNQIEQVLKKVNDFFDEIDFDQRTGRIELMLVEKKLNKSTSILHVSDGTLRFLCLMAILYNPNRGNVVCIDEPELGLHPDMINTLHEAIEYAAQTSQIIISTHSAHLLDYFDIKQIRVFEKDENNSTIVDQYTEEDFQGWYKTFNPGQMWRAGDIGGKRW